MSLASKQPATLYVVATPIGNLADMVPRAIEILQAVAWIAAEDTRHSAKLLAHFGIRTPMVAYHDHSDDGRVEQLLSHLSEGQSVALIADAGTPLISDPGYRLVQQARARGYPVRPVPGACALVAALSVSGLPSDRFCFEGFPPAKANARQQRFRDLAQEVRTLVFYESTHRILPSLQDMATVFGGEREAVIARELSKTFETVLAASLDQLIVQLERDPNQQRGEFVVLLAGALAVDTDAREHNEGVRVLEILLAEGVSVKQAAQLAARISGAKKNALYQHALGLA